MLYKPSQECYCCHYEFKADDSLEYLIAPPNPNRSSSPQVENSKKHKEKVAKNRELFEKVFPELRKQREEKERFSRVGARVKSDAEMEEIMDGLQEQEVRREGILGSNEK